MVNPIGPATRTALNNHGMTSIEVIIGRAAEETIQNLCCSSDVGMTGADATIIQIMLKKTVDFSLAFQFFLGYKSRLVLA